MKLKSALIVAAVASAFSVSAQAAPDFSDNFDSYPVNDPGTLNWAPPQASGWSVTAGTVDLIGEIPYDFFNFVRGNGNYIDLDGKFGSGLFANSVILNAGTPYTLSFDLAGSQRDIFDSVESVAVKFGTGSAIYSLLTSAPFATRTLNFTPLDSGPVSFSFQNLGRSNDMGALLDNVSVTAVPEPRSYALFLAGLGIMGAIARRRTSKA